jgi:SAM-dependent methyltransferase
MGIAGVQGSAAEAWGAVAAAWDEHVADVDEATSAETGLLLAGVAIRPGERVLELAAGPGSLGPMLAQAVGPDGSVVLSDLAPAMVEVAARRNASAGNVTCAVVDASAIDRPDASFDVVLARMGLMFTPSPLDALREIHRVLAVGGRLGAMTWGALDRNPWMTCLGMGAAIAGISADGPPTGPGGIFSLSDPAVVAELVAQAGFHDVAVTAEPVVFRAPDVETHLARVGSLAGPLATRLAEATPAQRAALHEAATSIAAPYVVADGLELPGEALVITARR